MDYDIYIIVSIILSVLNTVVMLFMAYKFLHTYQLNSYHMIRLFNWYGNTNGRYFKRLVLISILSLAGLLVTNVLFHGYAHEIFTYLGLIFYIILAFIFVKYESKIPKKKPLVYTKRMIRQYVVLGLLALVTNFFVFKLNWELMNIGEVFVTFRFALIALSPLILPVLVLLSCFLTAPFEILNNRRYQVRAKKKLKKRDDLIKIGITGSYAKTSVKVILASMLSKKYKVLATPASFNTPLGISICVNKLKSSHQVFIAEMGARNGGNIRELCDIVEPQYGIITGIANQHLETFFSIENIIKTKCELADSLKKRNGFLIINSDTKHLEDVIQRVDTEYQLCGVGADKRNSLFIRNVVVTNNGSEFDLVVDGETYNCKTRILGVHNISNIAVSAGLALKLGVDIRDIVLAISELEPPAHRLELVKTSNGMVILDDTFNANIEGATAALETLSLFDGRKVIVTPGLVELGVEEKQANKEFGKKIAHICELVVLIGKTRSEPIKKGLLEEGFDPEKILVFNSLDGAKKEFKRFLTPKDAVLLENDLPDDYNEIDELA